MDISHRERIADIVNASLLCMNIRNLTVALQGSESYSSLERIYRHMLALDDLMKTHASGSRAMMDFSYFISKGS
jgi:hypothetical protein